MLYHMHDAFINDDDDVEYTVKLQASSYSFTRGLLNPYWDSIVGR